MILPIVAYGCDIEVPKWDVPPGLSFLVRLSPPTLLKRPARAPSLAARAARTTMTSATASTNVERSWETMENGL